MVKSFLRHIDYPTHIGSNIESSRGVINVGSIFVEELFDLRFDSVAVLEEEIEAEEDGARCERESLRLFHCDRRIDFLLLFYLLFHEPVHFLKFLN